MKIKIIVPITAESFLKNAKKEYGHYLEKGTMLKDFDFDVEILKTGDGPFTIESEYYFGNISYYATILKKDLDIALTYDVTVDEDDDFNIPWSLEKSNFTGNRENMTIQVLIDGSLYQTINLSTGFNGSSSGSISFNLDEGEHTIIFRMDSPFYSGETVIRIEAEGPSSKKEAEKTWLEENILWVIIGG